jgi:cyclopropane-fatty-acyl-phospholipid synthase
VSRPPAGASQQAIMRHYDLSDDFFRLWLGEDLVYSCAWWEPGEGPEDLAAAQRRKIDFFADRLQVGGARVLDVGCGWGGLLDRFVRVHGADGGVGITLSPAQVEFADRREVPGVTFRLQSWVDHEPETAYDAITCVEATEHFASDRLDPDEKVEVYREFFRRAASWLRPGGRLGLQLICLDNVGHSGSRPGRGPFTDLVLEHIFPESMSASLSELVLGWETHFQLEELHDHPEHYRRTFRAWTLALREHEAQAQALVGAEVARAHARYFAGGEALFRLREQTLHRVVLVKRPQPKVWAVTVRPSDLTTAEPAPGASAAAVSAHYDVSNAFYRLWLGPTLMYSSALWAAGDELADLDTAQLRKIDYFAQQVVPADRPARVLDIGCGWGGALRRLAAQHPGGLEGVGLTLSPAQRDHLAEAPVPGVGIRLEDWQDHAPTRPYDAIVSFGAFEHFAPDGSTGPQRIATYRRFFGACHRWLAPGGRLGLETIAHDDAPDTDEPLGRGPLGDFVLSLYPESLCPHLGEIVLGLEPYFEIEVLRSDADDFARTCRAWLVGLRSHEQEAEALVGDEVTSRFRRYLAASELQFRTRAITNYRLVLHRRPVPRR